MTRSFLLAALLTVNFINASCQSSTQKKAKQTQDAIDAATKPDKTSASGQYLTATINGKVWTATEMTIDKDNSNIVQVHGKKGDTFLSFNLYKPAPGKEKSFSDTSPANWADETELDIYVGETGKAIITKMDDKWIEGTFSFTGKYKNKTATISNGSFRIPNPKQFN
jgi:hypothetical protein